eukprot:CAMPEP_0113940022 /NCGR_PEP_ID=MMETSP1339-20121228/6215_1 /TAXON_ID=94617 /ORGANISM="Fibrocapsa japonica" /LENGTH=123 /DNA_ID=CAMNT_0000943693 /DNA_START=785 /DNA_END=1154 /DNA_ORIENTATION=- /assembly_acc=CAM_ASM_000762
MAFVHGSHRACRLHQLVTTGTPSQKECHNLDLVGLVGWEAVDAGGVVGVPAGVGEVTVAAKPLRIPNIVRDGYIDHIPGAIHRGMLLLQYCYIPVCHKFVYAPRHVFVHEGAAGFVGSIVGGW